MKLVELEGPVCSPLICWSGVQLVVRGDLGVGRVRSRRWRGCKAEKISQGETVIGRAEIGPDAIRCDKIRFNLSTGSLPPSFFGRRPIDAGKLEERVALELLVLLYVIPPCRDRPVFNQDPESLRYDGVMKTIRGRHPAV
jgi:hypothetical protein